MFRDRRGLEGGRNSSTIRKAHRKRVHFRTSILERLEERLVLSPAPTTLAIVAVMGIYGGTATVTANLSSTGTPVAGESVDLHIGATDLGPVVTDTSGNATVPAASLALINVGTYTGDVTASFAGDASFDPSSGANDLTVTPAALTITADPGTKTYGATTTFAGTEFTTSTLFNGDTVTGATLTSAGATATVAGSPYAIVPGAAVGTGLSNYTITYANGSLDVTAAPLTITANNQTKVYGAALPTLTASYTGLVNGDTSASLATPPTITTNATAASHVSGSPYAITASGAVDSNYTISYVAGSLSVTKAPLTITANNQTKVYGAALPTLTASYTGLVNGDTSANLTTPPTITTTATAASGVAGSPYAITAAGAVDTDYTISYVAGSLSVTAAPVTITADDQSKVYLAALPTLTASYSGFVNGDTAASLTVLPTLSTTATVTSDVADSPYAITASGAVDPNYTISFVAGSLSVTAAALTITADNQTMVYGAAPPTLTASYSGFVNGDTPASLTTLPTLSTTATSTSDVSGSPYAITVSGAVDPDYTITYLAGSLTVTQAPLTVLIDDLSKVYGQVNPTLTGTVTGILNDDDVAANYTTSATQYGDVVDGGYAITLDGLGGTKAGDYTVTTSTPGSLTVTPAPLTITVDNLSKVYGQANPTLTGTVTGALNNDDVTAGYATTATASSDVVNGGYAITVSGLSGTKAGDYSAGTPTTGSLTVTPAPLTITVSDPAKEYGQANPAFTASYSGFVLGQGPSVLSGALGFATPATAASHVGAYAVTPNGLSATDYAINDIAGSLAVTPASLTITAVNIINSYGQPIPTLTAAYSGFVNGDTAASLTTPVNLTTPATVASHVGVYPISASGATSADYTISFVNGAIAIIPASLTVTPVNVINSYGLAIPTLTATYSGFLNGDTPASLTSPVKLSTAATAGSPVGVYPIAAGGGASADYTINYASGAVAIVANPGGVAFVSSLYQNILGRESGTYGLVFWLSALADGTSESDIANQIYDSPEGNAARSQHKVPFISENTAYQEALKAQAQA